MITAQQRVTGAKTISAPAAVATGDKYVLAWLDPDGTIWWTTLSLNENKNGYDTTKLVSTGFSTQAAPSLANLGGTVWLAWLQDPTKTALIPPANQQRTPPVILVSQLGTSGWSQPQPVWEVAGMYDGVAYQEQVSADYQQDLPSSGAITAPALVARTGSDLLLVWCEYAISGSDTPIVATPEGLAISGPIESQIFFSTWSKSTGWSTRASIAAALTEAPPALAAFGGVVSMAFKGQSDDAIWFCQYNGQHWSETAKLPNFQTSAGPALAFGDTGELHLAWKGASDNDIFTAKRPPASGSGWSSQTKIPVLATSRTPALASQLSASTAILLAWAGASDVGKGASDLFVGPLDALASQQSQTYVFTVANIWVVTQRTSNDESDTDYLTIAVAVSSKPGVTSTVEYLGNHNYGDEFDANLKVVVENIADDDRVVMVYIIVNQETLSGADISAHLGALNTKGSTLAQAALAAYTGGAAEVSALNLSLSVGSVLVPTSGSALEALGNSGWFAEIEPARGCDGPVAAGVHVFMGAKLRQGGNAAIDNCVGVTSQALCGDNSLYKVGWSTSVSG